MDIVLDEKSHKYFVAGREVSGVTTILKEVGFYDFGCVNQEMLEERARFGKAVHKALEFYDKGTLDVGSVPEQIKPYILIWKKFIADYSVQILEPEKKLFHAAYRYCGMADRIAVINNSVCILDIKTGNELPEHALQVAAYERAYRDDKTNPNKPKQTGMYKRYSVYLSETGYKVRRYDNKNDINVFLSALTLYQYKKNGGKK